MKQKQFLSLGETMLEHTLPNGLPVYYIPKPGFSKSFAMFATNFGSVDSCFTLEGKKIQTPDGVAHFLEHKMFEDEDGNALQKFSVTGASPNAFTSNSMTAYHFECTTEFYKNLEILLRFVSTPYFTDENVEKEKGIIGQEIGMNDDSPDWQAYVNLLQCLYERHTVRNSILGTVESIGAIDPALLFTCHRAFYSPSNMALVICGNADFEKVCQMAEDILPKTSAQIASREYGAESEFVFKPEAVTKMEISIPIFLMGYKDKPLQNGESRLRRQILGALSCRYLLGESSPLYVKLYEKGLINRSFSIEYEIFPEACCIMLGGESRDPRAVRQQVMKELQAIAKNGVDDVLFERLKRASYGSTLRLVDQPDEICRMQTEACFGGEDFFTFPKLYDTIHSDDVQAFLSAFSDERKCAIAIVEPLA